MLGTVGGALIHGESTFKKKKEKKLNQIVVLHEIGTTYSSSQKCS